MTPYHFLHIVRTFVIRLPTTVDAAPSLTQRIKSDKGGFTLVEMIVAVGLFAIVMLICISALLSLVDANRKAQALQSVMNNLNVALDGLVRNVREGTAYQCAATSPGSAPVYPSAYPATADCSNSGGEELSFEPYHQSAGAVSLWVYWFQKDANGVGRLYRSEDGVPADGVPITAPEVSIDDVKFYVIGASSADNVQPKVLVIIRGSAGATKATVRTTFHIQATAVQRQLDL